jgi:hypothetical protein
MQADAHEQVVRGPPVVFASDVAFNGKVGCDLSSTASGGYSVV